MMMTRPLFLLAPIALIALAGCPAAENNASDDEPDMVDSSKEDMPSDKEDQGKIEEDMPVTDEDMGMTGDDMEEDKDEGTAPLAATCAVVEKPRTILLDGSAPKTLSMALGCDEVVEPGEFTVTFAGAERVISAEDDALAIDCEPEGEMQRCEVTLQGVSLPGEDATKRAGVHGLALSGSNIEGEVITPVHIHRAYDEVLDESPSRETFALPDGFSTRGVDAKVKVLNGEPVVVSAQHTTTAGQAALHMSASSASPELTFTLTSVEDATLSSFEVFDRADGALEAALLTHDATAKRLCISGTTVSTSGSIDGDGYSFCQDDVTLNGIIDMQWQLFERQGEQVPAIKILDSAGDMLRPIRVVPSDQKVEVANPLPSFINLSASDVSSANAGFLSAQPESLKEEFEAKFWEVAPNGDLADSMLFSVLSSSNKGEQIASMAMPVSFPVVESYVGQSDTGQIFVLMLGMEDERALYETRLTEEGKSFTAPIAKDLPPNVSIARRRTTPLGEQGYAPHRLALYSEGGETLAFGRWPWDWRDRKKAQAREMPGGDLGPRDLGVGARDMHIPVSLIWADGESELSWVSPIQPSVVDAAEDTALSAGGPISLGIIDGGQKMAAIDPSIKIKDWNDSNIKSIRRVQEGNDDQDIMLLGGKTGLTQRVERFGDIIIDGAKLELDRTAGPPPVFTSNADDELGVALALKEVYSRTNPFGPGDDGAGEDNTQGIRIAAMAAVDDDKHPDATHAVWAIDAEGEPAGFGLLNLTASEDPLLGTKGDLVDIDSLTESSRTNSTEPTYIHAKIVLTYKSATDQETLLRLHPSERFGVVEVDQAVLLKSIDQDDVLTVDLTGAAPVTLDSLPTSDLVIASAPIILPPVTTRRYLGATLDAGEGAKPLSEEERKSPLLVSTTGDGCGAFKIERLDSTPEGALSSVTLYESVATMDDCADQEILLGVGDFDGSGDDSQVLTATPSGELHLFRRLHQVGDGVDEVVFSMETIATEAFSTMPAANVSSVSVADFNGDAIDDVAITFTDASETTVMFGDGAGGFLSDIARSAQSPRIAGAAGPNSLLDACSFDDLSSCEVEPVRSSGELLCGETDHL